MYHPFEILPVRRKSDITARVPLPDFWCILRSPQRDIEHLIG